MLLVGGHTAIETGVQSIALAVNIGNTRLSESAHFPKTSRLHINSSVESLRLPSILLPKPRYVRVRIQIHILVHLAIPSLLRSIEPRIDIQTLRARIAQSRIHIRLRNGRRWCHGIHNLCARRDGVSERFAARGFADVLGPDFGSVRGAVGVLAVSAAVHPEGGFLDVAAGDHVVVGFFVLKDGKEDAGFVPAAFDRGELDASLCLYESPVARDAIDADGVRVAVG